MKRLACALLVLLLLPGLAPAAAAAGRPTFGVTFDGAAEYLRIAKGTRSRPQERLRRAPARPPARCSTPRTARSATFVTVYADDFETIVRVTGYAEGRSSADIDHAAIPALGLGYITVTRENSARVLPHRQGRRARSIPTC